MSEKKEKTAEEKKATQEDTGYRRSEYRTRRGKVASYHCTTPSCRFGTLSEAAIKDHVASGHARFRSRRSRNRR